MPFITLPPRDHFLALNPDAVCRFKRQIRFGNFKINECWYWEGDTQKSDWGPEFGTFPILTDTGLIQAEAHRVSLIFENQIELANGFVGHRCVEHLCVNPTHLAKMAKSDVINRWVYKIEGPPPNQNETYLPDRSIDHRPIWEGWDLSEYTALAQELIQESELIRLMESDSFGAGLQK